MANQNIQIGIDLGTTNSTIAVNQNGDVEVIEKAGGIKCTPSVFGINKAGNKIVGQKAFDNYYKIASEEELSNNKAEIKRLMGTSDEILFPRAELKMLPEEIAAEILKNLKEDVLKKYPDFNTTAVIITTPAAFSTVQAEATKRAGNIAGFEHVVLLQEPIAAAMACGFENQENENWIIYDFGGGTFDVALISSQDGNLSVLGHNGDNFLGGKDVDQEIVDKILVPKILEEFSLEEFDRSNEKYKSIFAKLKGVAETAKIELSQDQEITIEVDEIGQDDRGDDIYVSFSMKRDNLNHLIESRVADTISLTKKTLKESGITNSSVKKIVLVGGSTQMPYIKESLERELKIEVDTSVDPLTVVARGACTFGMGQKIPQEILNKDLKNQKEEAKSIELNYEGLTSESEEMITGIIEELKDDDSDYYVQIQSDSGTYNSAKIKLKNGKFLDTVPVEQNKSNMYWIYLFNEVGDAVAISTDSFSITHGLTVSGAPLPHSIGIVLAKKDISNNFKLTNTREIIFEKGSILPLEYNGDQFKTVKKLMKDSDDNPLNVIIDEGESTIPGHNIFVCTTGIHGDTLPYDLPEGTEINISVKINESRELFVKVLIPMIEMELEGRATITAQDISTEDLSSELEHEKERLDSILQTCSSEEQEKIAEDVQSVSDSIENANLDEDEKRKANKKLKDLKVNLDDLEETKKMPQLKERFSSKVASVQELIFECPDEVIKSESKEQLKHIKQDGEKAITRDDAALLVRVIEQLDQIETRIALQHPDVWIDAYHNYVNGDYVFTDDDEAQYFIRKGKEAIESENIDELKRCVLELIALLPPDERADAESEISGITT